MDQHDKLSPGSNTSSYNKLGLYLVLVIFLYHAVLLPIYTLWFHPLAKYPGPRLWAVSKIPWALSFASGTYPRRVGELHNQYGPVVRIAPDELSYLGVSEAWADITGRRRNESGGVIENLKAGWYVSPQESGVAGALYQDHVRMRKVLSHGFSSGVMVQQQGIINGYVDLLIQRLREKSQNGTSPKDKIDMCSWYNYCTFDIIGDLAFGEPFGSLQESALHPWIGLVLSNVHQTAIGVVLKRFSPLTATFLPYLLPKSIKQKAQEFIRLSKEKVAKRLAAGGSRPDFVAVMSLGKKGQSLSREEVERNAIVLTIAGSETSATTLAAATYLLGKNSAVLKKLAQEIEGAFSKEDEIDLVSVSKLPYLSAVIDESLRLFPPAPGSLPRITPPEGNIILGQYIPGGTAVGIPQRATYLAESNFTRPKEFLPERWLDPNSNPGLSDFRHDNRSCFNPFSAGPRNCIGINLAYAELRLILTRIIYNFDITIADDCQNWMDQQRAYLMWDKTPLHVHLSVRR